MKDVQTLEKAARMALKTLEYIDLQDNDRDFLSYKECHDLDEAITALRQALSNSVEQPASKPWVELDHDDIHALMNEFFYRGMQPSGAHFANFASAIEAKLKEKNS